MAKRRTKEEKQQAQQQRKAELLEKDNGTSTKKDKTTITSIAFTGEKIHLVKRDLLKTVVITIGMLILLFGIYLYLR